MPRGGGLGKWQTQREKRRKQEVMASAPPSTILATMMTSTCLLYHLIHSTQGHKEESGGDSPLRGKQDSEVESCLMGEPILT